MQSAAGREPGVPDYAALFAALPTPYLVMTPDLVIVEANAAYLAVTGRTRAELLGVPVFEAFPPAPEALDATGVSRVQRSFERARDTGRPDTMPIQRYDIADPASGGLGARFWSLISVPVLDEHGRTVLVVQRTEDITEHMLARGRREGDGSGAPGARRRVADVEADLYARARELELARQAEADATQRLVALAEVALQMARTETVEELTSVIVGRGLAALGADGGGVAVRDDSPLLTVAVSAGLGRRVRAVYSSLPLDGPLPGSVSARTGQRVLLPDREAALAWHPDTAAVVRDTGCTAWAALPLRLGDRLLGSLSVGWAEARQFTADDLEVLEALAAQCAYGLDRMQARQAERAAATAARRMSETLQRSLLADPPRARGARGSRCATGPAAQEAQVGGDWYDAFLTTAGTTPGDRGRRRARPRRGRRHGPAAQPAARRRATRSANRRRPSCAPSTRALRDLVVGSLATAVLATSTADRRAGTGRCRCPGPTPATRRPCCSTPTARCACCRPSPTCCSAWTPTPAAPTARSCWSPAPRSCSTPTGWWSGAARASTTGLEWLTGAVRELGGQQVDALCDGLLELVGGHGHDDVALLALSALPGGPAAG